MTVRIRANTSVHSNFMMFIVIHLSEPTEAPSVLMLWPSGDETSLEAPNGLQHIHYYAAKLGTVHI